MQPVIKRFLREMAIFSCILFSAYALVAVAVKPEKEILFVLIGIGPGVVTLLSPRHAWLRLLGVMFMFAAVFGFGSLAAIYARIYLDMQPLAGYWDKYHFPFSVYVVYLGIWIGCWFWVRKGRT